ncbi:hypothetical protein EAO27_20425 [Sphingopyxis sp. YF1]|uniref:hypothetical protein n=1 Tax=Sphingopyxis sp. YF1 TaxID=2482763 RepID=UPI001F614936|nr:hypothetical protein [Sphingopyxis sp. YF1]UNU44808.1 hypothetical protein EAO27_20425 [Sphingopyxis sp. YF1]
MTSGKVVAHGRRYSDIRTDYPGHMVLLDCAARGEPYLLGTSRPDRADREVTIDAALIRFLLLGGDEHHPVHEKGIEVQGAWIAGKLDLDYVDVPRVLKLKDCTFAEEVVVRHAHLDSLVLSGSRLPTLLADRIELDGTLFLRAGETQTPFVCDGTLRLVNAQIGGDLTLRGAEIGTPGKAAPGHVLVADGMKVTGSLFLEGALVHGTIGLASASVGELADTRFAWPSGNEFDGFEYHKINGPTDSKMRIAWLKTQSHIRTREEAARALRNGRKPDFYPQPWEQLVKTLRATGHMTEAAEVAIAKQDMRRAACSVGMREPQAFPDHWAPAFRQTLDRGWNPLANLVARGWHYVYGKLSGYGHKPQRIVYLTLLLVAFSSLAYYEGRDHGLIGPTSPLVHMSGTTADCGAPGDPGARYHWTDSRCPVPPEYSTFQPFFFALDVTLPFVDLHQEADWGPLVANAAGETLWGGRALRWLMWFNIMFGWIASLMFVAIVSRLVEKD